MIEEVKTDEATESEREEFREIKKTFRGFIDH